MEKLSPKESVEGADTTNFMGLTNEASLHTLVFEYYYERANNCTRLIQ